MIFKNRLDFHNNTINFIETAHFSELVIKCALRNRLTTNMKSDSEFIQSENS